MPFCPRCGAEYRESTELCSDCGIELVASLPEPGSDETVDTQLVELASFPIASEAEMIQELLEGNNIRTVIRGDVDPIGATSGAEPATLLIDRSDLARAREIYEAYFAGDTGVEEMPPTET